MRHLTFVAQLLALGLLVAALLASMASAHGWYDPACCSDQDCAPVANVTVTVTAEGYLLQLGPGDHPLVGDRFIEKLFPFDDPRVRQSQDEYYHACVAAQTDWVYCIYVPFMGA